MDDLISRDFLREIVGSMPTAWEYGAAVSDIYDIIMKAPTIDAIPVEWMLQKRKAALQEGMRPEEVDAVDMMLWMWHKEQEAR